MHLYAMWGHRGGETLPHCTVPCPMGGSAKGIRILVLGCHFSSFEGHPTDVAACHAKIGKLAIAETTKLVVRGPERFALAQLQGNCLKKCCNAARRGGADGCV